MRISSKTSLLELGCIVCSELRKADINAFLSGGAVVTIYSENEYQSYDLDFISHADFKAISKVMERLGFTREKGRHFIHPNSKFFVEFPGTAATVGDEPIGEFEEIRTRAGVLKLLTPTYCVMDRLSAFYHWKDQQSLEQALLVAKARTVSIDRIRKWSEREGMSQKFMEFEKLLKGLRYFAIGTSERKIHPWRLCPDGEHWVRTHPLRTKKQVTTRHGHCARNPSGKDQLYPAEIQEIAERNFSGLPNRPCPLQLKFGKKGASYDDFISGWTQYWNDVLHPDTPLDPNLVKALIASESGFEPKKLANKKKAGSARGLTQITNDTRKTLADERGELKDHFVTATREELNDANVNICAGIRWLFYKRERASAKLGREATWEEGIAEYKGLTGSLKKGDERAKELMNRFRGYLEKYKECRKP